MKGKLQIKTIENDIGVWGLEFGLTEICFPSPGLGHKYKLKLILKQHYRITWLLLSRENILLYIGWRCNNSFDNFKI